MRSSIKLISMLFMVSVLLSVVLAADTSAENVNADLVDLDGDGEFVMGRKVLTEFNYEINDPYKPIDTAIVIDESGSMGGQMGSAKSGARDYVDQTNTAEGDENAVVEFASSASTLQSLTGSKSSAKNAINSIYAGGGTDLPAGVSEGHNALSGGSNPIQVMIVLADGGGGDPGAQADAARADGIEVHGIMYGSGASTSEFESMTDASDCSKNSNENTDGDNCWYANTNSINFVYEAIQEQVDQDVSGKLNLLMPDHALPISSYDTSQDLAGPNTRYTIENIPTSDGSYTREFYWYPTATGSQEIKTGDSYLRLTVDGEDEDYYFNNQVSGEIKYVDLNISETSINRVEDTVYINADLRNKGNIASKERYLEIYDEGGNFINRTIPSIPAGGVYEESFSVGANHEVFQDVDRISGHFDWQGPFDTLPVGEGQILEPDENNNQKLMGYPPRIESTSPDRVEWNETFRFSLNFDHYFPDTVQGNYTIYEDGNMIRDSVSYNKPAEGTLQTNAIKNDESRIWYNITSYIEGPAGSTAVYNHSYYVRNPRPEIYASEPKNLNPVYEQPVQLRAYIDDENNIENLDDLDVRIYNQDTGNLLTEETGVPPRSSVTYEWPDADKAGKVYRWNVTVSDRWHTISEVFRFRKSTRNSYRTETQSDYSYSAVVTSAGSPGNFEYTVNNPLDFDKNNMETSLSGVNANFADGSDSKSYSLPSKSSRTFDIVVSPDQSSTGQQYLTVTTENLNLGINNTDRIPVYVRENAKRSYGVPGLGLIQLLIIMLSSAALFYRKV